MFSYEDIAFSVAPASTSSHSSGPSPHCVVLAQNLIQTYSRCAKSMCLACMQYNNINMYICIYIYNYIYIYQNASKCHINKILIKKCHYSNCQLSTEGPGSQRNRCLQNHQPVQPAKAKLHFHQEGPEGEEKSHENIVHYGIPTGSPECQNWRPIPIVYIECA